MYIALIQILISLSQHRDLAARNILMDENMNCRVGDFGLSVDLAEASDENGGIYSGDEGAKIPVRWTALEVCVWRGRGSMYSRILFLVILLSLSTIFTHAPPLLLLVPYKRPLPFANSRLRRTCGRLVWCCGRSGRMRSCHTRDGTTRRWPNKWPRATVCPSRQTALTRSIAS